MPKNRIRRHPLRQPTSPSLTSYRSALPAYRSPYDPEPRFSLLQSFLASEPLRAVHRRHRIWHSQIPPKGKDELPISRLPTPISNIQYPISNIPYSISHIPYPARCNRASPQPPRASTTTFNPPGPGLAAIATASAVRSNGNRCVTKPRTSSFRPNTRRATSRCNVTSAE